MKRLIRHLAYTFGIEAEIIQVTKQKIGAEMMNHATWFNKIGHEDIANCLSIYGYHLFKLKQIDISKLRATLNDLKGCNIQYYANKHIFKKIIWGIMSLK